MLHARLGGRRLKAFNLGFSYSIYDASSQARAIASHAGVDFESVSCDLGAIADHLVPTLSDRRLKEAGGFQSRFVRVASALGRMLSADSALARRLDVMTGVTLTVQILHEQLIARRPEPRVPLTLREVGPMRARQAGA